MRIVSGNSQGNLPGQAVLAAVKLRARRRWSNGTQGLRPICSAQHKNYSLVISYGNYSMEISAKAAKTIVASRNVIGNNSGLAKIMMLKVKAARAAAYFM